MASKQRVEIKPNNQIQTLVGPTPVTVVAEQTGAVTTLDKAKGYYHTIFAFVGTLLVALNEATPLLNSLPDNGKQYVSALIAALTIAATFLKSNEIWIDNL